MYYHNKHFPVNASFADDENVALRRGQAILHHATLQCDLAYLCAHFTFLADTIQKLENSGSTLTRKVELTSDVQKRFATAPSGPVADSAIAKLKSVLYRDPGFSVLKELPKVLSCKHAAIPGGIKPSNEPKYKYPSPTSVDVERSFSA